MWFFWFIYKKNKDWEQCQFSYEWHSSQLLPAHSQTQTRNPTKKSSNLTCRFHHNISCMFQPNLVLKGSTEQNKSFLKSLIVF